MYTKEVPIGEREKIYKCTHTHTHIYILIGKKIYINSRLLQKNEVGKEKKGRNRKLCTREEKKKAYEAFHLQIMYISSPSIHVILKFY